MASLESVETPSGEVCPEDGALSFEYVIGLRLAALKKTLATAESCTGGLVASRITDVAGSSTYFRGGIVAYSNDLKVALLGVSKQTLLDYGAVSDAVVRQMAEGVRQRLSADYGIGVTGIAGPSGGTADKPVGLVYIGIATPEEVVVTRNEFTGTRLEIKAQTADTALAMLWELIE